MAAVMTGKNRGRSQLPQVNLFDIPELMRGARPSATSAARTDFEQRCHLLHAADAQSLPENRGDVPAGAPGSITTDDLEAMFPTMDSTLVRALALDAGAPQRALETLLALAASAAEPTKEPLPPRDLGVENTSSFPSLVDADGWEVPSKQLFDRDLEKDLGSAWCDRAKAAASKPSPQPVTRVSAVQKKRISKQREVSSLEATLESDYEFRHRLGEQRIQNRTRFRVAKSVEAPNSEDAPEDAEDLTPSHQSAISHSTIGADDNQ